MKIGVVVLHYKNHSDTQECLESLKKQDYPHFEIFLVDNGEKNLGFAEGSNVGIRRALEWGVDAVLLLNNDTTAAPDLLSQFAEAAKTYPDAGAFGAKIYYYDDPTVIWHAGGNVDPVSIRCYHEGCTDSDLDKKWDKVRDIAYACGCAFFIRKEAIEKVGLLEPKFFLIWEEIDWCWRARRGGYRILYVPEAKVWHKISQSFEGGNRGPQWQYYYHRNRLLFLKRNFSVSRRLRFYLTRLPRELFQMWVNKNPHHRSALKGVIHYFLNQFDTH